MPCQPYKDALIEVAATGTEPQGDLLAHLAVCDDCLAELEQEQALFASIDAGLHVAANAETPASLLPQVRARLDEEALPRRSWVSNWLVLASAAALVVAFFTARAIWLASVVHQPMELAEKPVMPPPLTAAHNGGRQVETPTGKNDVSSHQLVIAKSHSVPESLVKAKSTPEVLVPRDQELLLAEYAEQWRLHKRPLLLAQEFDATILSPLQVSPIQIDQLDVKLLAEEKSQ